MDKEKKFDLTKVSGELVKHPENVIKLHIASTPIASPVRNGKQQLYYTVFAYRKGDSKYLGEMNISLDDILSKRKPGRK